MTTDLAGVFPAFTICDRLRKARELTGLGQGPFADELGISRGTVSTYERDENAAFRPIVLRQWAIRTGVALEWLETGVEPAPTPPDGSRDGASASEALAEFTKRKQRRAQAHGLTGTADNSQYVAAA